MKKYLLVFAAALLVVSVAVPALADVQFLYGGQFRVRYNAGDDVWSGTSTGGYYGNYAPQTPNSLGYPNSYFNSNDNRNYLDQRLRLYFTFVGSKNLKVVTKFEVGDTKWGDPGDSAGGLGVRAGQNGGGNVGADSVAIEVKNAYIEFNIPQTPSTAIIGIQTITLLDSWIIDDDFSAGVLVTKLDPFRVTLGYIGGQYGAERRLGTGVVPIAGVTSSGYSHTFMPYTNQNLDADDFFLATDYTCGPFKVSGVAFLQDGHKTNLSIDPTNVAATPYSAFAGFTDSGFMPDQLNIKSNTLWDLGLNVTYKVDWLLTYVNFVKNLGSVDYIQPVKLVTASGSSASPTGTAVVSSAPPITESDYKGWMVDAGATWFCPPWTFNLNGFYITGPKISDIAGQNGTTAVTPSVAGLINSTAPISATNPNLAGLSTVGGAPFRGLSSTDVDWFTYPMATAKYTSEIIGGGVLGDDMHILRGFANGFGINTTNWGGPSALSTMYWRGYYAPSNLWTVTAGTSYQICPGTKVSASYWYWGTAEAVPVAFDPTSFAAAGVGTNPAATSTTTGYGTVANPNNLKLKMSSDIGHEFDFYLDQQIVDNLTLTFVFAYLIADDAFCPLPVANNTATAVSTAGVPSGGNAGNLYGTRFDQINPNLYTNPQASNAFKIGARIQWNF